MKKMKKNEKLLLLAVLMFSLSIGCKKETYYYQSCDNSYNNGYFYVTQYALPAGYTITNYIDFYTGGTLKDVRQQTTDAKYNITQYYY